jgi:1-acyl-sn-glycerol-3-phosphate acyltransferase
LTSRSAASSALHAQWPRTDEVPSPPAALLPYAAPLARRYFGRRYEVHLSGMHQIPARGPVLLAANHVGILDGPLLGAYAGRPVHAVVKREMFEGRLGAMLLSLGQIPVQRDAPDPRAVRQMLRVLRNGGVVSIYPEGARGTGDFSHSRLGAAYLALCSGAPVVPVACLGTRMPGALVSSYPPRGSRVDLVCGAPYVVASVPWPRRKAHVAAVAEDLRRYLAAHVRAACAATGQVLPGPAPDEAKDIAGRRGPEVGPAAAEVAG